MRKIHYSFLGFFAIILITSATLKQNSPERLFEKIVFVELSLEEDSVLFKPLSKAWHISWKLSPNVSVNGTPLMNYEKHKFSFENRTDNIWTLIHPKIIDGTIRPYYPYDPATYGMGIGDEGELRYPIFGENETFLNSEKARENLCNFLGFFGPTSDIPLIDEFGELLITVDENGMELLTYEAPDYMWYEDKDIIKYRLRVSVHFNEKGVEKKRVIKSISPIVNRYEETWISGEKELIWLNFEEIEPFLKNAYYFQQDWKPVTFLDHILNKVKNSKLQ